MNMFKKGGGNARRWGFLWALGFKPRLTSWPLSAPASGATTVQCVANPPHIFNIFQDSPRPFTYFSTLFQDFSRPPTYFSTLFQDPPRPFAYFTFFDTVPRCGPSRFKAPRAKGRKPKDQSRKPHQYFLRGSMSALSFPKLPGDVKDCCALPHRSRGQVSVGFY
jgi:hypothetical protein